MSLLFSACSFTDNKKEIQFSDSQTSKETGYNREAAGFYDSADTSVIISIVPEEKKITFHNFKIGKNYTLKYDGATVISDKYGTGMAMTQVSPGDIVDITFYKLAKRLNTMAYRVSPGIFLMLENLKFHQTKENFILLRKNMRCMKMSLLFQITNREN